MVNDRAAESKERHFTMVQDLPFKEGPSLSPKRAQNADPSCALRGEWAAFAAAMVPLGLQCDAVLLADEDNLRTPRLAPCTLVNRSRTNPIVFGY